MNFIEWEGVKDEGVTPSDSTGAVGPSRYVELVNLNFAIYDRSTNQLSTGTLNTLAGRPETDFIFDPQVIWDPQTQRFYYAMDDTIGNFANSLLAYGWSKTDTPTSAADFCHFTLDYPGDLFPDYPKLGDSFSWGARRGQHVRPARLRFRQFRRHVVPQAASRVHLQPAIRRADDQPSGSVWYADIHAHPAQSTDRPLILSDGVIVSVDPFDPGEQNFITRFNVSNGLFGPIIENPGKAIPIPTYAIPPPADQPGSPASIDTLDARLTQGVSAVDPRFPGKVAIWTQHTVLGGGGAQVRWYEVDPIGLALFQSGVATDPLLDVFNGAISPDRANNGASQAYGSNMVMGSTCRLRQNSPRSRWCRRSARAPSRPSCWFRHGLAHPELGSYPVAIQPGSPGTRDAGRLKGAARVLLTCRGGDGTA